MLRKRPPTKQPPKPEQVPGGPGASWQPVIVPRPQWLNSLRAALGLRMLPPIVRYQPVVQAPAVEEVAEDRTAIREAVPFALAAAVFAGVAVLVFVAYGVLSRQPTHIQSVSQGPLVLQAVERLQAGDVAGARELRDQATRRNPRDSLVFFFDGYLMAAAPDKGAAAAAQLAQEPATGAAAVRNLVTLGGYYQARGDLQAAARVLTQAVEAAPNDLTARFLATIALASAGRLHEAIAQADEMERRGLHPSLVCSLRGRAYLLLGDLPRARRDLEAASVYSDAPPSVRLSLAEVFMRQGDLRRANMEVDVALTVDPRNVEAMVAKGVIAERAGRPDRAEQWYRKAVTIDPKHSKALNNLAYLLAVTRRRPQEALPFAERAFRAAPGESAIMDTLGWIYHLLGRDADALPLLRKALEREPEQQEVQFHLAEALIGAGQRAEGRELLAKLAASSQDTPIRRAAQERLATLGQG